MLAHDERANPRQHFLARNITGGCGFGLRSKILGHLIIRLGDGTPVLLGFA